MVSLGVSPPRALTRLLALVTCFVIGCAQPLSPTDVAGRYVLERVGNDPLPVDWVGPADEPRRLLSSHIDLRADGSAETVMRFEEVGGLGAPVIVVHRAVWTFDVDGMRVTLRPPLCRALDCATGDAVELRLIGEALIGYGGLIHHRQPGPVGSTAE